MPWNTVMHRYAAGKLHAGSKKGPKVSSRAQAIAIMLSEKRKAAGGSSEHKSLVGRMHERREDTDERRRDG